MGVLNYRRNQSQECCNNNTNKTVGHVFWMCLMCWKKHIGGVYCISVLVRKLSFHLRLLGGIIEPALQHTIRLLPPQPTTTRGDQMEFPLWLWNSLFLHKMLLLLLCFHSQLINWPFKKNCCVWSIFTWWLQRKNSPLPLSTVKNKLWCVIFV